MLPLPGTCFLLHSVGCQLRHHLQKEDFLFILLKYATLPVPHTHALHCSLLLQLSPNQLELPSQFILFSVSSMKTYAPWKLLCVCLDHWGICNAQISDWQKKAFNKQQWGETLDRWILSHVTWGLHVMDRLWLSLSEEIPHTISSPLSHQASQLINGHPYGKAWGLISQLDQTPGASCLTWATELSPHSEGPGEGGHPSPCRSWKTQSSFLVFLYLWNPLSPFRTDVWESVKAHFPDLGTQ